MNRYHVSIVALILLPLANSPLAAAQRNWDGGAGTLSWGDFSNWSPNGNPAGDDIFIGNLESAGNATTLLDQSYAVDSLTIRNGADVVNSSD
ncbi:MAG: hypothetical protein H0T51_02145, partial [Pirellulales bacterium]|nr:hypothetical protein [Pirellulales bacterium]